MNRWWNARTDREKIILGAGLACLLALLYYSLLLAPLQDGAHKLRRQLSTEQELGSWLANIAPEVKRLRKAPSATVTGRSDSLLSIVDRTSKAAGLGKAMARLQPEGESEVRAWLDGAPFDETLRWLRTLETSYGIEINELSFSRGNEAGQVKARITLIRSN